MTQPSAAPPRSSPLGENLKFAGLVLATVLVAYLTYRILLPFLPAITWAIALSIVARPLHRRLQKKIHNQSLCAGITVLVITVALVLPIALLTQQVVSQAADLARTLSSPEGRQKLLQPIMSQPKLAEAVQWLQARMDISDQAQAIFGSAGSAVPGAFLGSLAGLAQLAIALFTMFFLLRDLDHFVGGLRGLVPLSDPDTEAIITRVTETIDASVRGRVLIALIQGALGGLMFWFLGLPGPVLWGAVMALFALVPMLGAFVVWLPAAVFLLATGHAVKAIVLVGWGALVIGTADNVLYPMLVGKDLRLHTVTIFFSVLGAVAVFGASGLVIGPVVFALADALIDIWGGRVARDNRTASREIVATPQSELTGEVKAR